MAGNWDLPQGRAAERTAGSLKQPCCAAAGTCLTCDYWTQRTADTTGGMQGWCDLFVKRTAADHGRQCTGWTPIEPHNDPDQGRRASDSKRP
jgi:hypothetical protein